MGDKGHGKEASTGRLSVMASSEVTYESPYCGGDSPRRSTPKRFNMEFTFLPRHASLDVLLTPVGFIRRFLIYCDVLSASCVGRVAGCG